jgi:predicted secreted protein
MKGAIEYPDHNHEGHEKIIKEMEATSRMKKAAVSCDRHLREIFDEEIASDPTLAQRMKFSKLFNKLYEVQSKQWPPCKSIHRLKELLKGETLNQEVRETFGILNGDSFYQVSNY